MPAEVRSPISRKGSKAGSIHRTESPGARSMPGALGDQSGEHPASVQVTGPGPEDSAVKSRRKRLP
jgi:hypothetical protein